MKSDQLETRLANAVRGWHQSRLRLRLRLRNAADGQRDFAWCKRDNRPVVTIVRVTRADTSFADVSPAIARRDKTGILSTTPPNQVR